MPESAKERWERLQGEAADAWAEYLAEKEPPIGPDTEVWVSRTLESTKKMTLKDLALQLRVPLSALTQRDSLKDAGSVIEKSAEWLDRDSLKGENGWEIESDSWSVTEVR